MEHTVTHWRAGAHEVDYVDSRGRGIWAIEFKSGRSGKAADLPCFRNRYPKTKALRVGMQGIPLAEFFSKPVRAWLA